MNRTTRTPRCGLCREHGHNYRTCPRVQIIHKQLIQCCRRIIIVNRIATLEDAFQYECPWMKDYSIIAYRALARKHGFDLTHSKAEYCRIMKQVYMTIAYYEIQIIMEDPFIRRSLLRWLTLQQQHDLYEDLQSYWAEVHNFRPVTRPMYLYLIEWHAQQETDVLESAFDCAICYEHIDTLPKQLKLNCGHRFCEGCMYKYLQTIQTRIEELDSTEEECTPKCPLCRTIVHSIEGDVETFNTKYQQQAYLVNDRTTL